MTIREFVKEHNEVFKGEPWHGESLIGTLERISFRLVNYKPQKGFHSIAELVKHLLVWRKFVLEKLKGNQEYDIELNSQDWEEEKLMERKEEWVLLLKELQASQEDLTTWLSGKKEDWLESQTPGKSYTNQYMVMGIMHHTLYHLGQIRLIRKMAEEYFSMPALPVVGKS